MRTKLFTKTSNLYENLFIYKRFQHTLSPSHNCYIFKKLSVPFLHKKSCKGELKTKIVLSISSQTDGPWVCAWQILCLSRLSDTDDGRSLIFHIYDDRSLILIRKESRTKAKEKRRETKRETATDPDYDFQFMQYFEAFDFLGCELNHTANVLNQSRKMKMLLLHSQGQVVVHHHRLL